VSWIEIEQFRRPMGMVRRCLMSRGGRGFAAAVSPIRHRELQMVMAVGMGDGVTALRGARVAVELVAGARVGLAKVARAAVVAGLLTEIQ
jgi:hypothetical protein